MSASFAAVDIMLDKPRTLLFRLVDLRDLCRRLGTGDRPATMQDIFTRMQGLDIDCLTWALVFGLRHEGARFTADEMLDLIQTHVVSKGMTLAEPIRWVSEALERSGIVSRPDQGADAGEAGRAPA